MKSWALETVNCFALLKCKLTNDSYSRSKYLRARFAEDNHVPIKHKKSVIRVKRREIQTLYCPIGLLFQRLLSPGFYLNA
jgi:hypothetical protein